MRRIVWFLVLALAIAIIGLMALTPTTDKDGLGVLVDDAG